MNNPIGFLDDLDLSELILWLRDAVRGRDERLLLDRDRSPMQVLAKHAQYLRPQTYDRLSRACLKLLVEELRTTPEIDEECIDELLVLVEGMKIRESAEVLLSFASSENSPLSELLRFSILNVLIELDRPTYEFWVSLCGKDPGLYGLFALSAVKVKWGARRAIQFLGQWKMPPDIDFVEIEEEVEDIICEFNVQHPGELLPVDRQTIDGGVLRIIENATLGTAVRIPSMDGGSSISSFKKKISEFPNVGTSPMLIEG